MDRRPALDPECHMDTSDGNRVASGPHFVNATEACVFFLPARSQMTSIGDTNERGCLCASDPQLRSSQRWHCSGDADQQ